MKYYMHPVTKKMISEEAYMNFMFGEEFMKSNDKGSLKEYEECDDSLLL